MLKFIALAALALCAACPTPPPAVEPVPAPPVPTDAGTTVVMPETQVIAPLAP